MPKISEANATMPNMMNRFPAEISSTNSASTRPIPVKVTVPTMIPAVEVAMATPIILRAPATRPTFKSENPCSK